MSLGHHKQLLDMPSFKMRLTTDQTLHPNQTWHQLLWDNIDWDDDDLYTITGGEIVFKEYGRWHLASSIELNINTSSAVYLAITIGDTLPFSQGYASTNPGSTHRVRLNCIGYADVEPGDYARVYALAAETNKALNGPKCWFAGHQVGLNSSLAT